MTTSNPVVPRLDTAVSSGAIPSQAQLYERRPAATSNLWPIFDLGSIALTLIFFGPIATRLARNSLHTAPSHFLPGSLIGASACVLLFWLLGVYSRIPSPISVCETEQLLRGVSYITVVAALGTSCLDLRLGAIVFVWSGLIGLLLVVQRGVVRRLLPSRGQRVRALIYARQLDIELFTIIHTVSDYGIEFAGLVYDSPWELNGDTEILCRFIGTRDELKRIASQTEASQILVVGFDAASQETQRIVQTCERLKLQCSILLDPRRLSNAQPAYTFMDELPVLQRPTIAVRAQFVYLKRLLDLAIGSYLLMLALPIGIVVAAIIKYDSRGPVFFRQQRIGKDGRPFELLKFRTMHAGSQKYHRSPTSDRDPRITRVGRLLRRLSLDELPQLLNVLKGDMSLVGPRPEMPFIANQYGDAARARLAVRPGITGLWQISRARSLPIHHNLQYDLFYIERQSIFLDAAILLRTLAAVIRGVGAA
jgi:exopolysaccharide biosynthesis polyprenyl glycosylphosphotransferase